MKKIIIGLLIAMLMMVGCQKKDNSMDMLDKLEQKKTLVVGLSADYPPYEFHAKIDGKDEIVGFDVDIAKNIAKELGVELKIEEMSFDKLLGGLKTGMIDMAISGMNPTDERRKEVDFSDIYYKSGFSVLTSKKNLDKIKSFDDLNNPSYTLVVQLGSTQEQVAQEKLPKVTLEARTDSTQMVREVLTGLIDGTLVETSVAESYVSGNPELAIEEDIEALGSDEDTGTAIAVQKGNEKFVKKLNEIIQSMKDDGSIKELYLKNLELANHVEE